MPVPEWLFGPAGDLRPLPAPGMNVVNTVERFGGVHNAINGARTVDVLGHRANYEFDLPYLDPEEYYWLEALFTESIPGPFYLVDPLRKNLLSREAAMGRPADSSGRGVGVVNNAAIQWQKFDTAPAQWLNRGIKWTNLHAYPEYGSGLRFDRSLFVPLFQDKPLTVSVYVNSNQAIPAHWTLRFFNSSRVEIGSDNDDPLITLPVGEWSRITQTFTEFPADAALGQIEFWYEPGGGATSTTAVQLVGFQAEYTAEPTDVSVGGGSMRVAIDQMATTSPYYPLQTVALSLMEV